MAEQWSSQFKTRELRNQNFNSAVWNDFDFRADDVIIASYPKCGTTWVQQIVAQLIFDGEENLKVHEISPWLDEALTPFDTLEKLHAQTHRRIIKSHLPLDALNVSPIAKYIYVARDGRDAVWSFYDMQANAKRFAFETERGESLDPSVPHRAAPRMELDPDRRRYFNRWLHEDGYPIWPFWENVRTWWAGRHSSNILLVHFADLKANLERQIRRIGDYLSIDTHSDRWPIILEHCSFDYMKKHAADVAPLGGIMFEDGPQAFINKGLNGRWRDVLWREDIAEYERIAREQLGDVCARWLERGSMQNDAA